MIRLLFILALATLLAVPVKAQEVLTNCPQIVVTGPSGIPLPGEPFRFRGEVRPQNGESLPPLQYVWSVSEGVISKGQGTLAIEVSVFERGLSTTAKLEVIGLPKGCVAEIWETTIIDPEPVATKLDEFTVPISRIEPRRIERIRSEIIGNPSALVFVHLSVANNGAHTRDDLLRALRLDEPGKPRITFVDVDSLGDFIQFWLVPPGATPPMPATPLCPTINLVGPNGIVSRGDDIEVSVDTTFPDLSSLQFYWESNVGSFLKGQGTRHIRIATDQLESMEMETVKVNLRIEGFPEGCQSTVSEEYGVAPQIKDVFPVDEYGDVSASNERSRLDNLAVLIKSTPNTGYVVKYFAPGTPKRTMHRAINRVERHLLNRGVSRERFVITTIYSEKNRTLLWSQPPGTKPPLD